MGLYLDVHNKIEGLTKEGVADAHEKDLRVQRKYGVNYLKYWFVATVLKELAERLVPQGVWMSRGRRRSLGTSG